MGEAKKSTTSNAGIKQLSNGDSVIPSSTRADGSVRKEIRVKPGYKPPEDVQVYKNRTAEAWKYRGKAGVPGAEPVVEVVHAASQKNAKRREARKRAAASNGNEEQEIDSRVQDCNGSGNDQDKGDTEPKELDKAKEARKLAKKLRQAKELEDKKQQGDSLLPEQLAKVIKIQELVRQLNSLGFDAEGEAKSAVPD